MTDDVICAHPKQMLINRVPYCLACQTYLYTGICAKCRLPLDEHDLVGVEEPVCPKAVTP